MIVFWNNIKRLFKDKRSLMTNILIPVAFMILYLMVSMRSNPMRIGIIDNDNTKLTNMLKSNLKISGSLYNIKKQEINQSLINSDLQYVISIDKGFTKKVISLQPANIKAYSIKETNSSVPLKMYLNNFLNSMKNIAAASNKDEQKFYKGLEYYKAGSIEVNYSSMAVKKKMDGNHAGLGMLVLFMLLYASNASELIMEDKAYKIFDRIFTCPITAKSYMLQNILSFVAISVFQVVAAFGVTSLVFNGGFNVPIINLIIIFSIFSIVSVSFGVAITSISKNSRQSSVLITLIASPLSMLGGCFWPRDIMPKFLQNISNFIPTTWIMKASDKILSGESLTHLYLEIGIMMLFSLTFFLFGAWKSEEIKK